MLYGGQGGVIPRMNRTLHVKPVKVPLDLRTTLYGTHTEWSVLGDRQIEHNRVLALSKGGDFFEHSPSASLFRERFLPAVKYLKKT